ncbi:FAD-dependent oxidoreductase [Nocardia sp. NBC_00511]|uniref:FAD-dependent oxidoreductase n=1 Tax=Nocardia sp. NBC_00511 TaxID=2903591 RepID=UPI002F908E56
MRVVVVGSGISGLSSAAALLDAGHQVTVCSDTPIEATTSYLAAAVWFPTAIARSPQTTEWSTTTFAHLERQAATRTPGVRMRESLALYREHPHVPSWSRLVRGFRDADDDELPPTYRAGFRFRVPMVEMPIYLPWLKDSITVRGARWMRCVIHHLDDLADLAPDVIVNCAGLRAAHLVDDPRLVPIRGQIVRVTNPGLSMSVRDEAHPLGRAYVHPRSNDCILGGSLQVGEWDVQPDPELTRSILRRCQDLVPALADSAVVETLVGLRPGRETVRLELDTTTIPDTPVVHNYGHGGSGITLGHGCATTVADIVGRL